VALQTLLNSPTGAGSGGKVNWTRVPVQRVYDGLLQASPSTINGVSYTSVAALDAAQQAGTITPAQFAAELQRIGAIAAGKVTPSTMGATELGSLRADRGALGPNETAIRLLQPGEYLAEGHLGAPMATGTAGLRGGVGGGLVAVMVEGGIVLLNPDEHPEALRDLGTAGGLGVVGGATGGATEQLVGAALTRQAITTGGLDAAGGLGSSRTTAATTPRPSRRSPPATDGRYLRGSSRPLSTSGAVTSTRRHTWR
jgi:hypothetical protein